MKNNLITKLNKNLITNLNSKNKLSRRDFLSSLGTLGALAFSSCALPDKYKYWYDIADNPKVAKIKKFCEEMAKSDIGTASAIDCWLNGYNLEDEITVDGNINYIKDIDNQKKWDYAQLPNKTLSSLRGDCEDIALLGLALYYEFTGNVGSIETGTVDEFGHIEPNYHGETFYGSEFKKERTIPWEDIARDIYFVDELGWVN